MYRAVLLMTLFLVALTTSTTIPKRDDPRLEKECRDLELVTVNRDPALTSLQAKCKSGNDEVTSRLNLNHCLHWRSSSNPSFRVRKDGDGLKDGDCIDCVLNNEAKLLCSCRGGSSYRDKPQKRFVEGINLNEAIKVKDGYLECHGIKGDKR
ncbi:hypothetical protein BDV28DRAFT_135598 [Aspergillus coremiiformis]|uniref:Cyanovirin-N domain-containing protein n=1 Tax=Aspergillus coremiiformis TaxID=138285 RepID=A0A5N6Z691_9EURO|nr:hypothetical protein BDV28DRAFT_135598 [Aspergillus coremiiformis]